MRKRYLCLGVSSYALGIALGICSMNFFMGICVAGMVLALIMLFKKQISILIFALLFIAGGIYGNYADTKTSPLEKYIVNPCSGEMFVTGVESFSDSFVTVNATVTQVNNEKISEPVLFTIYGISDIDVNKKIYFEDIKFKIPDDARNDGGFDYRRYLKSKGIYYVASADVNDLRASGSDGFAVFRFFRTLKQEFARKCQKIWGNNYAAEIIPAILVGNDVLISELLKDLFSEAGITHILVASGMHVTVVILIFSVLLFPLRNKRRVYDLLLGTAIICFAMLVGYTPSMVRAVSSFFIYYIARKLLRSADPVTVLFEAMGIILIINPLSIHNLSFQLSFGAVFGIITITPHIIARLSWFIYPPYVVYRLPRWIGRKIEKGYRMIVNATAVSISAQLGVLPLMMDAFGSASVFALLVNVVISFVIMFMYGVSAIACIFNLEPFVTVTGWLCDFVVWMAKLISVIPGNKFQLPQSNMVTISIVAFVIVCLLRCKVPKFTRFFEPTAFLCVGIAVFSCAIITYIPPDKAEVTFLNVEQGDCALIRLADRKTVMVDTGTEAMFNSEVLDYLERKCIDIIDVLFLSHHDSDHAGGLETLQENKMVRKVVTGKQFAKGVEPEIHQIVEKGDKIDVGNACFEILYASENASNSNDSSVVMRMDCGQSSFLFTGDIGKNAEPLVENVDTDVLKVSHHGAKDASEEDFLARVSPKISVISVDKNNSYGHPDREVVDRLEKVSEAVFRTDRDKTITIMCDWEGNLKLTKRLEKAKIDNRK